MLSKKQLEDAAKCEQGECGETCSMYDEICISSCISRPAKTALAYREMLKKLEWFTVGVNATWDKPIKMCPSCRELKEKGHEPDCKLAAMLKGLEAEG
jgi:hypothetical protein